MLQLHSLKELSGQFAGDATDRNNLRLLENRSVKVGLILGQTSRRRKSIPGLVKDSEVVYLE